MSMDTALNAKATNAPRNVSSEQFYSHALDNCPYFQVGSDSASSTVRACTVGKISPPSLRQEYLSSVQRGALDAKSGLGAQSLAGPPIPKQGIKLAEALAA